MSKRIGIVLIVLAVLAFLGVSRAIAQENSPSAPQAALGAGFTYQGQLKNTDGSLVSSTCDFKFTLWDALSAGSQVGAVNAVNGAILEGPFSVIVNGGGEFGSTAFTGQARWLQIAVKCVGDTVFTTLLPRQVISPAPYALSLRPGALIQGEGGATASGLKVQNTTLSGLVYGVQGLSSSTTGRGVYGYASASSGTTYGVVGQASSIAGSGVYGYANAVSGTTYGVQGVSSSTTGRGVYGYASAASGITYGVVGLTSSTDGSGLYGYASAASGATFGVRGESVSTTGRGVYGYASAGSGYTYGVLGISNSTSGTAVEALANALNGITHGVYALSRSNSGSGVHALVNATSGITYGVWAQSMSTSGTGVYGYVSSSSGTTYGVYGLSNSNTGYGVYGYATAPSGSACGVLGLSHSTGGSGVSGYANAASGPTKGIKGVSDSTSGVGVYGFTAASSGYTFGVVGDSNSTSGIGVAGNAINSTGYTYGVVGYAKSLQGWGVYAYGNIGATGTKAAVVATAGYGWRSLYAMESPDVWFEDIGSAQLDKGLAVITIDPLFAQTVNLKEPYHIFLTPRGDCALYVAENTFTSFTVRALGGGSCSIAFDYRIVAKRLGYEQTRLAPAQDPAILQPAAPETSPAVDQQPKEQPQP